MQSEVCWSNGNPPSQGLGNHTISFLGVWLHPHPPPPVLSQQPGCWCRPQAWPGPEWSAGACICTGWLLQSSHSVSWVNLDLVERQLLLCSTTSTRLSPWSSRQFLRMIKCSLRWYNYHSFFAKQTLFSEFDKLWTLWNGRATGRWWIKGCSPPQCPLVQGNSPP